MWFTFGSLTESNQVPWPCSKRGRKGRDVLFRGLNDPEVFHTNSGICCSHRSPGRASVGLLAVLAAVQTPATGCAAGHRGGGGEASPLIAKSRRNLGGRRPSPWLFLCA